MPAACIRRATPADAESLVTLVEKYWAFEQIGNFDRTRVAQILATLLLTRELGTAWIVERERAPEGYLIACYVFSLEHGGLTAEIDELYLEPALRGSGVGRRLLEVAESELRAAGCTNVSLQLGRDNDAARAFYERCGYRSRSRYELLDKALAAAPLV